MKSRKWLLVLLGSWFFFSPLSGFHGNLLPASEKNPSSLPQPGDYLPKISFPNSLSHEEVRYLGIDPKKALSLDEIKGKIILIEFINSNCLYCIKAVPILKQIYQAIDEDTNLKGAVKILAIGAGDTKTEVVHFKNNYEIPYPVIPDTEYKAHDAVGGPRVPFLFVATKSPKKRWFVVRAQVGFVETLESETIVFFDEDWRDADGRGKQPSSVEDFIQELKTILAKVGGTSGPNKPSR